MYTERIFIACEDADRTSRNCSVSITTVYLTLLVHIHYMDLCLHRVVAEDHVVEDNRLMVAWLEHAKHIDMAHPQGRLRTDTLGPRSLPDPRRANEDRAPVSRQFSCAQARALAVNVRNVVFFDDGIVFPEGEFSGTLGVDWRDSGVVTRFDVLELIRVSSESKRFFGTAFAFRTGDGTVVGEFTSFGDVLEALGYRTNRLYVGMVSLEVEHSFVSTCESANKLADDVTMGIAVSVELGGNSAPLDWAHSIDEGVQLITVNGCLTVGQESVTRVEPEWH